MSVSFELPFAANAIRFIGKGVSWVERMEMLSSYRIAAFDALASFGPKSAIMGRSISVAKSICGTSS
jgi:hypothetical protein